MIYKKKKLFSLPLFSLRKKKKISRNFLSPESFSKGEKSKKMRVKNFGSFFGKKSRFFQMKTRK